MIDDPAALPTEDVVVERRGAIAVVWFNRPDRLNAFRGPTFDQLHSTLDRLATDQPTAALVLTGRGRAFCAGEDLMEARQAAIGGWRLREVRSELVRLQNLTRKVAEYPKPVIAAVNGPAVGLGAELSLACDVRLAAREAYFYYPEAQRGLSPTNGTFHYLPQIVGHGRAADWLLTARKIPAAEALDAGLVTGLYDGETLVEAAVGFAARIA
jgi:enoyl-CoA hydratase/carnithine racemase